LVGVVDVVEVLGLELLRLLVVVVRALSAEGKIQHWLDCLRTNRTIIRENSAIFPDNKSRHWRNTKVKALPRSRDLWLAKVLSVEQGDIP
jgi:ribosomal protein L39E